MPHDRVPLVTHGRPRSKSPDLVLLDVAQQYSPRAAWAAEHTIVLDLSGLERLFGDARAIGEALRGQLADRGLQTHVAIAGTRTAAHLMAVARAGLTVVDPGGEATALAPLALDVLTEIRAAPPEPRVSIQGPTRFYRSSPVQELMRPRRRVLKADGMPDARENRIGAGRRSAGHVAPMGHSHAGQVAALPAPELAARLGRRRPARAGAGARRRRRSARAARGRRAVRGHARARVADRRARAAVVRAEPAVRSALRASRSARPRRRRFCTSSSGSSPRDVWRSRLELPSPMQGSARAADAGAARSRIASAAGGIDAVTLRVDPTRRLAPCSTRCSSGRVRARIRCRR